MSRRGYEILPPDRWSGSNKYYRLRVFEDPNPETLQEVMELVAKYEKPLRVKVNLSGNIDHLMKVYIPLLERLDKISHVRGIPVSLGICGCCTKRLNSITTSQRWQSRWESY